MTPISAQYGCRASRSRWLPWVIVKSKSNPSGKPASASSASHPRGRRRTPRRARAGSPGCRRAGRSPWGSHPGAPRRRRSRGRSPSRAPGRRGGRPTAGARAPDLVEGDDVLDGAAVGDESRSGGLDLSLRVGGDVGEVDLTGDRGVDARLRVEDRLELVGVERIVGRFRVVFLLHQQVRVALDSGVGVDGERPRPVGGRVERRAVGRAGLADDRAGRHDEVRLEAGLGLGEDKGRGVFVDDDDVDDLVLATRLEAVVRGQVGVASRGEVRLDELGAEGRAVLEGRAGVEVERQLRLVFVVLEVRHEVGNDLAVLVEHEQRVVHALEEHALTAAVAHGVVAQRGLVTVQSDDELRRVDGAATRTASSAGTGACAEREG